MVKAATKTTRKTTKTARRAPASTNNRNTRSKASTTKAKLESEVEDKPKKTTTARKSSTTKTTTGRTQTKKAATPKKAEAKTSTTTKKSSTSSTATRKPRTTAATKTNTETQTKTATSKTTSRSKATGASKTTRAKTAATKTPQKKAAITRKTAARKTPTRKTNSRRKKEEVVQQEEDIVVLSPEEVVEENLEEELFPEDTYQELEVVVPEVEEEEHHKEEPEEDIIDVEFFDENTVDKAIDLVNVAFVHHTSKIIDYKEGRRLIVKDTMGNRYKLNLKPSPNPVVDPKVSSFYVMRPANFREDEKFESQLFALFSNEKVATLFLGNIVKIHDGGNGNKTPEDESYNAHERGNHLVTIHSSYLKSDGTFSFIANWLLKNKKIVLSVLAIILFLGVVLSFALGAFSSKNSAGSQATQSHKSYVSLSPTEEKIRADNTVIAEINRIQNNEPPISSVGTNIRSHGLDAEKLALLKKNMQDDVAKLIELQGKMNSGMGAETGGHSIPFNSQTDRFGISNVPPEDSWSTSTGARMSVPSGSNGVASQKDLAEFGIINQ